MTSSLREIRNRIKSVKSSEKITKAMMMVAASKFRKAQEDFRNSKPYYEHVKNTLEKVAYPTDHEKIDIHPLLIPRKKIEKTEFFVLTSDRGLCGTFNTNIIRKVQDLLHKSNSSEKIQLSTFGRKGYEALKKEKIVIRKNYNYISKNNSVYLKAYQIFSEFENMYHSGDVDSLFIVYNEFKSAINQRVVIKQLLPIMIEKNVSNSIEYIFEPSRQEILVDLIPKYLTAQIFRAFLESFTSEHAARMVAMDNATRNAKEVIDNFTLKYNRIRQAVITKELIEILSGAEALV